MAHKIVAKPGDLIEFPRGLYSHWAIYVGDYEVVHLIPVASDENPSSSVPLWSFLDGIGLVSRDKLNAVFCKKDCLVNNFLDDKYEARDGCVIVKEACGQVGRTMRYGLSFYNCEHFVTELRYGKPESRQVKEAAVIAGVTGGVFVAAALGGILYSRTRTRKRNEENTTTVTGPSHEQPVPSLPPNANTCCTSL